MNVHSSEYIEIELAAREPKPFFPHYPSEYEAEIKEFTSTTGEPWKWWGHTHTPPPKHGTPPKYVGRFYLPKKQVEAKVWVPCPCCWPNHRKFGRKGGLIAWFPDEKVIRLIGPECYAALNQEGHDVAIADLKRREKEKSELDYILRCLGRLPEWLAAINQMVLIAYQADQFFPMISSRIHDSLRIKLWRHIRNGTLSVTEEIAGIRVGRDGEPEEYTERLSTPLFQLEGAKALNPERKLITPTLEEMRIALKKLSHFTEETVRTRPAQERLAISKELRRILRCVQTMQERLRDEMRLLGQVNINRLRQWATDPRGPVDFEIERKDGELSMRGRKEYNGIPIPEELRTNYLPTVDLPLE
ncbi:hypothetical protein [Sinorhizobium medicae]|uniref:hypothetical protein n=1 Tax=Sinorhizobium medicae TaxID=110321 RepID=UPI0012972971|nr:hypothetical protein [Sinorhizobium medicae]MQX45744.1 hypothetical protein [Sinorhizobium medicae]